MIPSIDHSLLSPSGKMSKRARDAAMKREHDRLFPPGFWDSPKPTEAEARQAKADNLRRAAGDMLALADRGMSPASFRRQAKRLLAEAEKLVQA